MPISWSTTDLHFWKCYHWLVRKTSNCYRHVIFNVAVVLVLTVLLHERNCRVLIKHLALLSGWFRPVWLGHWWQGKCMLSIATSHTDIALWRWYIAHGIIWPREGWSLHRLLAASRKVPMAISKYSSLNGNCFIRESNVILINWPTYIMICNILPQSRRKKYVHGGGGPMSN